MTSETTWHLTRFEQRTRPFQALISNLEPLQIVA